MGALYDAYVTEKTAASKTTKMILQARERGAPFKALAIGVAERLPGATNENVVETATKLEAAFRQRVRQHQRRSRGVIGDHNRVLADRRGGGPRSSGKEELMNPQYRKTLIEEWNAPPPDTCPPPPFEDEPYDPDRDEGLGDPGLPTCEHDHEGG
jgi:hypothetical protein